MTLFDTCRGDPERDGRRCAWCGGPIDPRARSDARFCGKRCRQASSRFNLTARRRVEQLADRSAPMRFAYADPPYPGRAERYYGDHRDFAGEVDHVELVGRLIGFDGWALSTSADSLEHVLSCCAGETRPVRVAAWVRGGRGRSSYRGPVSSWEPVVYAGGRDGSYRLDSLVHHARPRTTDPARVIGQKPARFARWLFELLGAQPGDQLDDLFPASGGIGRAWEQYVSGPAAGGA